MNKTWQIYYNTLFGAIGALIAWMLVGMLPTTAWNVHLANAVSGMGVGLFIGGLIGAVEGALIKGSLLRTFTGMLLGAFVGMFSGLLGLVLGGVVFLLIGGGLIARMLGWMALGLFLGIGQGVVSLHFKRTAYGLVGGTLAGLVGGALYEVLTQAYLQQSGQAQVFLSALGLVLIGASLGSIIPLSVAVLGKLASQRGLVVFQNGPRRNNEVEVIGDASLGSSDGCDVYVQDKNVEPKQGTIHKGAQSFEILNAGNNQAFQVNGQAVAPGQKALLPDNALISMGAIQMKFRVR